MKKLRRLAAPCMHYLSGVENQKPQLYIISLFRYKTFSITLQKPILNLAYDRKVKYGLVFLD